MELSGAAGDCKRAGSVGVWDGAEKRVSGGELQDCWKEEEGYF